MFTSRWILPLAVALAVFAAGIAAQTSKPAVKKNQRATPTPTLSDKDAPEPTPPKKNGRPVDSTPTPVAPTQTAKPTYFYEFSQPAFFVSKINIEHDENGRGQISFVKNVSDEVITDPLEVSKKALDRINNVLAAMDFINSSANYQYEKDYSHLGNVTIRVVKGDRSREAKYNWTTEPNAKALADEYRRLSNQYIWIFDMNLARMNQPLECPKLIDLLDSYIRRNEISDAEQIAPFLRELSNDERLPLIARNHAARLVKQIGDKK